MKKLWLLFIIYSSISTYGALRLYIDGLGSIYQLTHGLTCVILSVGFYKDKIKFNF